MVQHSPEAKDRARFRVANAISKGTLVRQPCEKCGAEPTHAHHDDYDKPLDVRWLYIAHHAEVHRLLPRAKPRSLGVGTLTEAGERRFMNRPRRSMSLRKFRAQVASLHEVVDVARRDDEGNLQVLGYWTPYVQWDAGAPLPPVSGIAEAFDEADNMCPNCVTPWKCNGPHLSDETVAGRRHRPPMRVQLEDIPLEPEAPPIDPKTFTPPRASFGAPKPAPKVRKR